MTTQKDIAFIIHYPFQWYVYKNTYRELGERAEFIVDMGAFFPVEQPAGLLERVVALLEKNGARYRVLREDDYRDPEYLEFFFSPYKTLVSVWERGSMLLPCNDEKRKVNMTYGSGKELTMVRPSRGIHDVILAYGPRDHALFSYYTRSVIVGNPKFDDWFNGDIDTESIATITAALVPTKKTVLYLPTHGDLSSIGLLSVSLAKLTPTYNIVVKLHYFTVEEEKEHVSALRQAGVLLVTDDVDLLPLLSVADVVISDNSSAIFDAVLADKPVVVTDFLSDEYLDVSHKMLRELRRTQQGASTYSKSIEQLIKREGRVPTLTSPAHVPEVLAEALTDPEHFRQERKELRSELYSYTDGKCAQRAAAEILKVTDAPKSHERPILYHAIETYKAHIGVLPRDQQRLLERTLRNTEKLLGATASANSHSYTVVWTCTRHVHGPDCVRSLKAVLSLARVRGPYEVVVIDTGCHAPLAVSAKQGTVRTLPSVDALCEELARPVAPSDKNIVVCTTSTALLPHRWLIDLETAYADEVVAAAGSIALRKAETVFEQYEQYLLSKRLGLYYFESFVPRLYEVSNRAFDQNPCGDPRAFSCDARLYVPRIHRCARVDDLTALLKARAVQRGELCFLPSQVTAITPPYESLVDFARAQYAEGVRHYVLRADVLGTGSSYTPYAEVQYSDVAHLFSRGLKYVRVALIVGLARSLWLMGRYTASFVRLYHRTILRHRSVVSQEQKKQSA